MFVIASSVPAAAREAHWFLVAILIAIAVLFASAIYLTGRALFTKSEKLTLAPGHIRHAQAILKWIAFAAPLLMLMGVSVDTYHWIIETGIKGPFGPVFPYLLLSEFLVAIVLAFAISMFAQIGIGLIFLKKLRHEKREPTRP